MLCEGVTSIVRIIMMRYSIEDWLWRGLFSGIAVLLLIVGTMSSASARTFGPAMDRFLQDYKKAWESPSPARLLRLSDDPGIFLDLVALDRWDYLASSKVIISDVQYETHIRNELVLNLTRQQHDLFLQGTFSSGQVHERLVLRPSRGTLRVVEYRGARSGVRQSAVAKTWASKRAAERTLMQAMNALVRHDVTSCQEKLAQTFARVNPQLESLPEPFDGKNVVKANAYYVRAACRTLKRQEDGGDITESDLTDLGTAITLYPNHLLARLLRARLLMEQSRTTDTSGTVQRLMLAKSDLEVIAKRYPELEDAASLTTLVEAVLALSAKQSLPDHQRERTRLLGLLFNAQNEIAGELLTKLGEPAALRRVAPEILAYASELAIADENPAKAKELLYLYGAHCDGCLGDPYLRARLAELEADTVSAMTLYSDIIGSDPSYRDAVWRYTKIALERSDEVRKDALRRLASVSSRLPRYERRVLGLIVALATHSRKLPALIDVLAERFADVPLPPGVRLTLVGGLQRHALKTR
ncbi:MAG: hypothetical protein CMH54_05295 [Myxococcales bacterium]|nr:hypothetical protein [Myxococcales bacterium]